MNKHTYITIAALSVGLCSTAQGYEDALRFNTNELTGTARSQAMGSAFGAVGADLSTMSINPAGMAVYRATEMGLSLGVNVVKTESNYWDSKTEDDRVRVPFSQAGVGVAFGKQREDETGLVKNNLFIGYNRICDYSRTASYSDPFAYNSLLDYFSTDEQSHAGTTGALAYNAYLTNDTTQNGTTYTYNVWEHFFKGGLDNTFRYDEQGLGLVNMRKTVKETGSKGVFNIGYAANIANKLYVGGSIDVYVLWYDMVANHGEQFEGYLDTDLNPGAPTSFTYRNTLEQDASGVAFRLGLIYRPWQPLRIGFSISSPTFWGVKESFDAQIYNPANNTTYRSDDYDYDYRYRSPSRFVASICGTFGKGGMLSFDYEHTNQARSKFREKDDDDDDLFNNGFDGVNTAMKELIMASQSTFRVGGELSVLNPIYLRAGYRLTTPGIKKEFYFNKPVDYAISGGIGLRMKNFFVDLTYVCNVKKGDEWVLPDTAEGYLYEVNDPAKLTTHNRRGVITFGFRF